MALALNHPQSNGKFMDNLDLDNPEYMREMMRPPEVKEDVRLMSQRRRVSLVLKSAAFRKDLEKITASHMKDGTLSPQVIALQNLVDYLTPHAKLGSSAFSRCTTMPVIPINDLRTSGGESFSKVERMLRCKLTSVFRIMDLFGWATSSDNHATVKISRDGDEFLMDPSGLLFSEITASSLIKVNLAGDILHRGSLCLSFDLPGWLLHAAIYRAKPNTRCVIHVSTPASSVLSTLPTGLLPISQEAMIVGEAAIYDFDPNSGNSTEQELNIIIEALNSKPEDCRALIVKNNGILVFAETIEEAWMHAYTLNLACESQLKLAALGIDELILPSQEARHRAMTAGRTPSQIQMGANMPGQCWKAGELEFEALMRRLDAAGYRTGHIYRLGQSLKQARAGDQSVAGQTGRSSTRHVSGPLDEVVVPPTCSSVGKYHPDTTDQPASATRAKTLSLQRHWSNTPNAYKRSQIEETGTDHPQTIFKWTRDELDESPIEEEDEEDARSPARAFSPVRKVQKRRKRAKTLPRAATDDYPLTPAAAKSHTLTAGISLATEDPNVYAPQGNDPRELRLAQKRLRDRYYKGVRTAGPRSRLLAGLDEDYDMGYAHSDGELPPDVRASSPISASKVFSGPTSPVGTLMRLDPSNPPKPEAGHAILIGAVSKGIIKNKQRHNVALYQSLYQPNPFGNVTDDDLERYRINVDRKQKGLPTLEEEEARRAMEERVAAEARARQEALEKARKSSPKRHFFSGIGKSRPKSDTSTVDEATEDTDKEDKKHKKKRRFKLPSFGIKKSERKKKDAEEQ